MNKIKNVREMGVAYIKGERRGVGMTIKISGHEIASTLQRGKRQFHKF